MVVQWLHFGGDPLAVGLKGLAESVALREEREDVRK